MEIHEAGVWELTSCYRSASVMRPNLRAVLTASPRLVAFSFRKVLCRCVSTDGALRPRSCAIRFVVCPFATPRRICISRDVRATVVACDSGVSLATRRRTSGIILRGTGLSLRIAAPRARCNSPGPESFRTYPEQPACIIRNRSSLDSETVQAMTFTCGCRSNSVRVVAAPSISGICTSISTRSGLSVVMASRAARPDDASPHRRNPAVVPSIVRAAARGRTLSSTTSTLYDLRSDGALGM
jgi:hypothetical protein